MKFEKYFSDNKRLLTFIINIIYAHFPDICLLDFWGECVKCTGMSTPCFHFDQKAEINSLCWTFKDAMERFIRLVVHYDRCDYQEGLVNIRAEMALIYRLLEDVGIYFGSTQYWNNTQESLVPEDHYLTLGEATCFLTTAWHKLLGIFDISCQDDPPGYKYLGVCKCGDYYVKTRSSQMFCSKSCAQGERYKRYAAKKKGVKK